MKRFMLIVFFLFSFSIYGAGFQITGTDLENFELIFNPSNVNFSDPESVLKGVLDCKMTIQSDMNTRLHIEKIALNTFQKLFEPILTKKCFSSFLKPMKAKILRMQKEVAKEEFSYTFKITKKGKQSTKITLFFEVVPKGCTSRGKFRGKIDLILEEKKWKVLQLYLQTWRSYQPDSFLKGPAFFENFPAPKSFHINIASPQNTFRSFLAVREKHKQLQNPNRIFTAFKKFIEFFGAKNLQGKFRKKIYNNIKYKLVKTVLKGDSATIFFNIVEGSNYLKRQNFKFELVKEGDKWLIDSYQVRYSAKGKWMQRSYLPY